MQREADKWPDPKARHLANEFHSFRLKESWKNISPLSGRYLPFKRRRAECYQNGCTRHKRVGLLITANWLTIGSLTGDSL